MCYGSSALRSHILEGNHSSVMDFFMFEKHKTVSVDADSLENTFTSDVLDIFLYPYKKKQLMKDAVFSL